MNEIQRLHEEAIFRAKNYKKSESQLLEILIKIDDKMGFKNLGYNTLHDYCTIALNLSSDRAYSLSKIAKTNDIAPEIPKLISEQKIHVSNATQIARIMTHENKKKWIEKAQSLSKRELDREIKKEYPETIPKERIRPITGELSEAKLVIPRELEEGLIKLQDIYSTKTKKPLSLVETLNIMKNECLKKHDKVAKAQRNLVPGPIKIEPPKGRIALPSQLIHQLNIRDQGQCVHRYLGGTRCKEKKWLHMHHLIPISHGGTNTLDNLQTVCSGHHAFRHQQSTPYSQRPNKI